MSVRAQKQEFDVFTINVGNTHCRMFGWHRDGTMAHCLEWRTQSVVPAKLVSVIRDQGAADATVVLSGVVPDLKEGLRSRLEKAGFNVSVFREDLPAPIVILPKPADRVGDDRIAAALGAIYLDSKCAWVVIDVGTAVTVNAIKPGLGRRLPRFEGGLIFPGANISLRAMKEHTAQLPHLNALRSVREPIFIGKSTEEAMRWGVYHAQREAVVGLARAQLKALGPQTKLALTGGGSADPQLERQLIDALPRKEGVLVKFDPLVHLGLFAAWKSQQESRQRK